MKNEKCMIALAVNVCLLMGLVLAGTTTHIYATTDIYAITDIYDDIVLHDLLTGSPRTVSAHPSLKWSPSVYGDYFVWADGRNGVGNRDIYLYDFALGVETQLTSDPNDQYAPVIHGNRVVYIDERSGNEDIYMYDISTGVETPIVTDPAAQISPAVYGGIIAWLDYRNGAYPDVYMYDVSTGTESPVSIHAAHYSPSFSGGGYVSIYEDKIVWFDYHTGNADVHMYDLSTGTETQITTNTWDQTFPDIYGDIIVWQDNRNSPSPDPDTEQKDIYMYDLSTGTESAVSTDPAPDRLPAIHGDRIVWTRDEDVLMYDMSTVTESVIEIGAGVLSHPDIHGHKIVWVGPAPTEPAIRLLYLPLNWTGTQAAFNTAAETQVDFFRDSIPLQECPEQVSVTTLNVATQNFDTFACSSTNCGVGSIGPFVEGLGINTADYTAVVGLVDGTPCWPTRGCSSGGHDVVWADVVRPITTAHELGHQFGLEDEYCSNPAGSTDCRCNDGDEGDQTWANCDDTGGDGAATGDLNWLDSDLDCDPGSGSCCSGCGGTYPEVCCEGNENDDGGICTMSYANAPAPRAFCEHCQTHLSSLDQLNCPLAGMSLAMVAPFATNQIIDVALLVHNDDSVDAEKIILRRGRPSTDHIRGGNYRLEVVGSGGERIWSQDVDIYFDYYGPVEKGVDYSAIQYESFPLLRRIPYHPGMAELRLYHREKLIFSRTLTFCNKNNVCDVTETYLTCPGDCPPDKPDGLCLANRDGVCDLDCDGRVDPDCEMDCVECLDSDNDGVINAWDLCPSTPPCFAVDRHGCRRCESAECIKIIKPESGDVITTTLTLAATGCPTPAAVKFTLQWPNPSSRKTIFFEWVDKDPADGWGFFNIPITPMVLAPVRILAQALDTEGNILCKSEWIPFSFGIPKRLILSD